MQPSPRNRSVPSTLPGSVRQQVNLYALAAGAAGVGMLALARSAEAKIVYTPAHIKIAPNSTVSLDLNHDGKNDFTFKNVLSISSNAPSFRSDRLSIIAANTNQVAGLARYASALVAGVKIGTSAAFSGGSLSMAFGMDQGGSLYCDGKWNSVQNRYLGMKFTIAGQTHFGWARLNTRCDLYKVESVLTGYAYETVAGEAITTGQTKDDSDQAGALSNIDFSALQSPAARQAGLGMLALGAPALSIWRREEPSFGDA
jgi:hypothetical protein